MMSIAPQRQNPFSANSLEWKLWEAFHAVDPFLDWEVSYDLSVAWKGRTHAIDIPLSELVAFSTNELRQQLANLFGEEK